MDLAGLFPARNVHPSIFSARLVNLHDDSPQRARAILPRDLIDLRLNRGGKVPRVVEVDLGFAKNGSALFDCDLDAHVAPLYVAAATRKRTTPSAIRPRLGQVDVSPNPRPGFRGSRVSRPSKSDGSLLSRPFHIGGMAANTTPARTQDAAIQMRSIGPFPSGSTVRTTNLTPCPPLLTQHRCLFCRYFDSGQPNPEAEERALEMRYGPEAALVGACQHPEHTATINSKWD